MSRGTDTVVLDDQGGDFEYDGNDWTSLTTGNAAVRDGTLSMLTAPGNMTALFFGSQISVYGTVSAVRDGKAPTPVSSVYLIDGVQLGSYTAPNVSAEVDGTLFWASGTLDVNKHIIEVQITSASPDYAFYFDYMLFVPAPTVSAGTSDILATSSSQDTSSSTSAALTSSALTNRLSLAPPSSSSTSVTATSASQSVTAQADVVNAPRHNTGAIAGGVVGGVVGLFAVLCALLFWRRRSRAGNHLPHEIDNAGDSPIRELGAGGISGVTPFLLPRDYNTSSASFVPPETAGPLAPGVPGAPVITVTQSKTRLASSPLTGSGFAVNEGSGSQQRLLGPDPSVASSSQASSGVPPQGLTRPARPEDNTNGGTSRGNRPPVRSPKGPQPPDAAGPSPPPRRQPAVHADSGLRFPGGEVPLELVAQPRSEFPPAYTPR